MVNRRQHPRIEFHQKVEIKLYHVDGHPDLAGQTLVGQSSDISEGGVGIRLPRDIPVGTEMKLRVFVMDPPSAFIHRAAVRWVLGDEKRTNFFIGVEFIGSSPEHMSEWRDLVRHLAFRAQGQGTRS